MKPQRFIKAPQDQGVLSVWQDQVAQRDPKLRKRLLQRERELLPRFATYYEKLKALPRRVRRSLQRKWKQSLAGVALLMALGQGPAFADTIPVTAASPDMVADGACSLIEAIVNANADAATHPDCPTGRRADTIVLPQGITQTLTTVIDPANDHGPNGLPVITTRITISGNGATIERARAQGTPDFRIFQVGLENDEGRLELQQTTITGGQIVGRGGNFEKAGGGILNFYGTLILTNSTISGNGTAYGGGVYNQEDATITNSTISDNYADIGGGGVQNDGTLTITNSTISGNDTAYYGGGVRNYENGNLTITNSTISRNNANNFGGGVLNESFVTITNSTISGNTSNRGGGIYNSSNNYLYLYTTLVSGNSARFGADIDASVSNVNVDRFNLFGHKGLTTVEAIVGITPGESDITATSDGIDPTALNAIVDTKEGLPALENNGGLTLTNALVTDSPAVDAVQTGCPPPDTDQRGIRRPQGARCDIGAFEGAVRRPILNIRLNVFCSIDPDIGNNATASIFNSGGEGASLTIALPADTSTFDPDNPQSGKTPPDFIGPDDEVSVSVFCNPCKGKTFVVEAVGERSLSRERVEATTTTCRQPQPPPGSDDDRDGVDNEVDNCLTKKNPSQDDDDNDGIGDDCDGTPG